jgi:hypothetical protein
MRYCSVCSLSSIGLLCVGIDEFALCRVAAAGHADGVLIVISCRHFLKLAAAVAAQAIY